MSEDTTTRETTRDASGDAPAEEVPQKERKTNKAGESPPWSCKGGSKNGG